MPTPKTSASHPLQIQALSVGQGGGRLGLTLCPGKHQSNAQSGAWARDLEADMAVIAAFGAKALVTLMEREELDFLRVPPERLRAAAGMHGIDWYHLPIPDQGVPGEDFEAAWDYAGLRLRGLLGAGNNVVVHCMGGLGRTGTVAARLLIEHGVSAEEAITSVRAARHGTIENATQEAHVRNYVPTLPAPEALQRRERAWGCILGGALGDAFGYEVEFIKLTGIRQRFGPEGLREAVLHDGKLMVSDDTQMTLFTAEGMFRGLRQGGSSDAILGAVHRAYLDWYETQRGQQRKHDPVGELALAPELREERAPGITCLNALLSGGMGSPERPVNDSKGCGGVMRVAPLGLLEGFSEGEIFDMGLRAAAFTHTHPTGYLASGMMSLLVFYLAGGLSPHAAVEAAMPRLRVWEGQRETRKAVQKAMELASVAGTPPEQDVKALGLGWVAEEALAIGLYAVLRGGNFREVLAIAANHDGDSDSTASIAGQLWGAWRGMEGMPQHWIQALDVHRPLTRLLSAGLRAHF